VFNSDVYENWVNSDAAGNGGSVDAEKQALHEFAHSARLTLPANSLLVFVRRKAETTRGPGSARRASRSDRWCGWYRLEDTVTDLEAPCDCSDTCRSSLC
jgi:hypothetical protein